MLSLQRLREPKCVYQGDMAKKWKLIPKSRLSYLLYGVFVFWRQSYILQLHGMQWQKRRDANSNMKFFRSCFPLTHRVRSCFCICLVLVLWRLAFVSYRAAFHDLWQPLESISSGSCGAPPQYLFCPFSCDVLLSSSLSSSKVLVHQKQAWGHIPSSVAASDCLCVPYFCVTLPCSLLCTKLFPKAHCYNKVYDFLIQPQGKIRKMQMDEMCVK